MWTTYRFNKRVLGIAVGERSLLIAELSAARLQNSIFRVAEFVYPSGVTLEKPESLGLGLATFLRQNGFTARRVILGVPARWLILRTHTLPPADPHDAQAILALQAQAAATPELGEMVFDFSGDPSELKPSDITLMGLPAVWKNRLTTLANSAGLKPIAITPCAAALSTASANTSPLVLSIGSEGAEFAVFEGQRITVLRHLGTGTSNSSLAGELRRTVAMLPVGLEAVSEQAAAWNKTCPAMMLWNDVSLSPADFQAIQDAVGISVVQGNPLTFPATLPADSRAGASAIALALAWLPNHRPDVNFLRPKLCAPSRRIVTRKAAWFAATAAVIALIVSLACIDYFSIERDIARSDERLRNWEPALAIARPFVANMQIVEGYQRGKPKSLACLCDVTTMLPEDGQTYLTSFHLQGNMKGDMAGRSINDKDVINLVDKLRAGGRFVDVKQKLEGRGVGAEMTFSVTFTYVPS